jgi:lysozyme family protein
MTYPASFRRSVHHTLAAEGVFSAHSWDPGGATKYGITEAVARRHGYDVRELTVPQAVGIYYSDYYQRPGFDSIESWHVAGELFDTEVNTGRSCLIAQRALVYNLFVSENELGGIDGNWGPRTRSLVNRTAERYEPNLVAALNGEQYRYYHAIRTSKPELFSRAIRGWVKRAGLPLPEIDRAKWEAA